jgi:cytoskeletal protein RodZ
VDTTIDESLMSKRESPIGLVLALVATFGLSAGGIWWAHQFGFVTHSSVENQLQTTANSSDSNIPEANTTQTSMSALSVSNSKSTQNAQSPIKTTVTPIKVAPIRAKTGDDLENFPVKGTVKFVVDSSAQTTDEGEQVLERLVQEIKNYSTEGVAIKIALYGGWEESSKTLAQQRGENIAGYLRDRGLKHKIFISSRSSGENAKQTRNPPLQVSLVKK